jgi:site-specific DNA-methyltransferase (adenine-specific)
LEKTYQTTEPAFALYSKYNNKNVKGEIFNGDALAYLRNMQKDLAAIVFLDPPFNLGKDYGNGKREDRRPHSEYISWLFGLIKESERVLKPGGALYLYHLPRVAIQLAGLISEFLQFRHWIAVSMKNTFVRGNWLYPAHYALLYYTKGFPAHFHRPKIAPLKCRRCNAYVKDYGGYRHIIEKNGINLSDFWDDISPVRHHSRKSRIANELPMTLVERVVSISGAPGYLYVDPFAGGGNGVLAALRAGMCFSACDIEEEYCRLISNRVEEAIAEIGRNENA